MGAQIVTENSQKASLFEKNSNRSVVLCIPILNTIISKLRAQFLLLYTMFKPLLKKLIITCSSLLALSTTAVAAPTCSNILSQTTNGFQFIDSGASGFTFRKGNKVYKVYYSDNMYEHHNLSDGYSVAKHEAMLLTEFHKLIASAGATEFRPLNFHRALNAEQIGLEAILEERLLEASKRSVISMNGIMVSEFVEGRLLNEILEDPNVPEAYKAELAQRFNDALLKIEGHLNGTTNNPDRPLNMGWGKNQLQEHDMFYFEDEAGQGVIPFNTRVEIRPGRIVGLTSAANIIVDSNGLFVLIDPN